jgi:predicted RNA-binding protein YlqC (UPF0109 family)
MTTTGSSPFAEPDFSALNPTGSEDEPDGALFDEDVDEDLGDEDFEEDDELDDAGENGDAAVAQAQGHEGDDEGNRTKGGTARSVLEHVACSIVDDRESVAVDVGETRNGVRLSLQVAQGDMGRIIGRRGRTAQALRTLVRAAAARDGQEASVDIVD